MDKEHHAAHSPVFICPMKIGTFIVLTGYFLESRKASLIEELLHSSLLDAELIRLALLYQIISGLLQALLITGCPKLSLSIYFLSDQLMFSFSCHQ